jgi:hypothetical protein
MEKERETMRAFKKRRPDLDRLFPDPVIDYKKRQSGERDEPEYISEDAGSFDSGQKDAADCLDQKKKSQPGRS